MRISKITIDNFRSIKHAEITADKFNVFVGQNNHGKTNFFEAIDWFYGAKGDIDKIRFLLMFLNLWCEIAEAPVVNISAT